MKFDKKIRLKYSVQNSFFVILFLSLVLMIGVISKQFVYVKDMTQAENSILTQGSIEVVQSMDGPVNITVFASKDSGKEKFREQLLLFFAKYQREKSDIKISFINHIEDPDKATELGIRDDGEMVVEYNKRSQKINPPFAEQEFTNLLVRLARENEKPIMYLDGHGEKKLIGTKTSDLGGFGEKLISQGLSFSNPDLAILSEVPKEGAMLVIASPEIDVGEIESKKVLNYLEQGGNLLWLLDDNNFRGLDEVAKYLGLTVSDESVVEPASKKYGGNEDITYATIYGDHPITRNFGMRTQFSKAHEVKAKDSYELGWDVSELIDVGMGGWLPSNKKDKNKRLDFVRGEDKPGPITIAIALKRKFGEKGQRVVVVGNSTFLSNTFITSYSNLGLGINIVNWLVGDDKIISIQPKPLKDINITIPEDAKSFIIAWLIFHGFQFIIPISLFSLGFYVWYRRRKA